ncbi:Dihydrofolate synthase @ Folylpolyglutamate synthase [hydrothermal vent metagenome]|uniref:Dihydrofolate synthase @ Folylpolyglutamate synthase n=1 Tax=hydrothermal vent metagenome TaxID=652676 RepID=A0A1W1ELM1_9ZZZZ
MNFIEYINSKPLFYKEIDYRRVYNAYDILEPYINHPITIHLVGTNGKGSTGRTIAHLLYKQNYSVVHYSSPHIIEFNERIWIDGKNIDNNTLEDAHQKLYKILSSKVSDSLTYFEYTTLLALVIASSCDVLILEAGLGGEFDATNIAPKDLSVITPIGLDHQEFLGDNIKDIATTKINSIDKKVLLSIGTTNEVEKIAIDIAEQKNAKVYLSSKSNIKGFDSYLKDNIQTAISSIEILELKYNIDDLKSLELFGRYYKLQDNIIIDVGHNPLSAKAIKDNLKDKKVVLVYNTLEDKNFKEIINILKDNIIRVDIIDIDTPRALKSEILIDYLESMGIENSKFSQIKRDEEYLVYGSFYTIEAFIRLNDNEF